MSNNIGKICLIEWIDSTEWTGWKKLPLTESDPLFIKTVGFVLKQTKKKIVIAHSVCFDAQNVLGALVIPKGAVKKITVIMGDEK